MRIRCLATTGNHLPAAYLAAPLGLTNRTEFDLTVGKEYVVYAIDTIDDRTYFFICADSFTNYPMRVPAPLFETIDGTRSKHWKTVTRANGLQETAIDAWISDPYFHEKLVEGNAAAVALFASHKAAMDAEALER